jgi:hypothetical protein
MRVTRHESSSVRLAGRIRIGALKANKKTATTMRDDGYDRCQVPLSLLPLLLLLSPLQQQLAKQQAKKS